MCILKMIQSFATNGVKAFRKASFGNYNSESEAVKSIKEELSEGNSSRKEDAMNLYRDRKNVGADMRKSFNQIVLNNG